MFWKESESAIPAYSQPVHDGVGEIQRRPHFQEVSRLPVAMETWELMPGVSEGNHTHDKGTGGPLEEIYYFLEGDGIMEVDGREMPVAAGDAVLVPPGSDHGFHNTGGGPLRLLLIWGRPGAE